MEVQTKIIAIIGAGKITSELVERIKQLEQSVRLEEQYKIVIFNSTNLYAPDYLNLFKIFRKHFAFETTTKQQLLDYGVAEIFENVSIHKIDHDTNVIHYIKRDEARSVSRTQVLYDTNLKRYQQKYDYIIYADVPYAYARDPKDVLPNTSNIVYLGNQKDLELYRNAYLTEFKTCVIFGSTYLGLNTALELARQGRVVHLVVRDKHLFRNVWSNFVEYKIFEDLRNLKVHIIQSPTDYEFEYANVGNTIASVHFKIGQQKTKVVTDIVLIAKTHIETDFKLFHQFSKIDQTLYQKYGVKRLITNNLQLKTLNAYALGIGTIEETYLKHEDPHGIMWDDFQKYLYKKNRFEMAKMLEIIRNNQLGKPVQLVHEITAEVIDEFCYDGQNFKCVQLGKSISYAKRNSKASYGVIDIKVKPEKYYVGVSISASFLLDIEARTIEGLVIKAEALDPEILERVFADYYLFATQFTHVISQKISIDNLLFSEFSLQSPTTIAGRMWINLYNELTTLYVNE